MGAPIRFVDEATGTVVELDEKSKPEPPIRFGVMPKRVVTNYGGRNQKSVQFLGLEYPPIELGGRWRDQDLGRGEALRLARALEALAANAGIVRIEYGAQERWGVLDVEIDERRDGWVEWSAKLEVVWAQPPETIPSPIALPTPNDLGTLAEVQLAEVDRLIADPPADLVGSYLTDATLALLKAQNALDRALQPLRDVENYAELTTDIVKLSASLTKVSARSLASFINTLEVTTGESMSTIGGVAGENVALWRDDVYLAGINAIAALVRLARELLEALSPSNGTTHNVQAGQTIQRIAAIYYGDSAAWQIIADANDLDSTSLTPGQTLRIPARRG